MTIAAGGREVEPSQFNQVTLGVQPSHPFDGELWVDGNAIPYLYYGGQFNLLGESGKARLLRKGTPGASSGSQTQDTSLFTITGLEVPTAHMLRLAIKFSLTGTGTPHSRMGLKINSTIVNNTLASNGFDVLTAAPGCVAISIGQRAASGNRGMMYGGSASDIRVGATAAIPNAVITGLEILIQMGGASRTLTADSYQLWEFR